MNNPIIRQSQYRWITLAAVMAVLLCFIPVVLYCNKYALDTLLAGVAGCILILLLFWAGKMYRDPQMPLWKAMVLQLLTLLVIPYSSYYGLGWHLDHWMGTVIFMVPTITALVMISWRKGEKAVTTQTRAILLYELVLFSLAAIYSIGEGHIYTETMLWILESLIWVYVFWRENQIGAEALSATPQKQRRLHWIAWNICFFLLAVQYGNYRNFILCWQPLIILSLPFLLTELYRRLISPEPTDIPGWMDRLRPFGIWVYYGLCLSICALSSVSHTYYKVGSPVEVALYILLALLVHRTEERSGESGKKTKGGLPSAFLFVAICAVMSLALNERIREIIYHLGGPSLLLDRVVRADWLAYKQAAFRSFFSGDIQPILDQYGFAGYGVWTFAKGDDLASALFLGSKLFLILIPLAEVLISVLLLRLDTGDKAADRVAKYLAVSYLFRTVLFLIFTVTMTTCRWIILPFSEMGLVDLALLLLFLRYSSGERQPEKEGVPSIEQ